MNFLRVKQSWFSYFIFGANDNKCTSYFRSFLLIFQRCFSASTINKYFPILTEKNMRWLSCSQLTSLEDSQILKTNKVALEAIQADYIEALSLGQQKAYFKVCGFDNLDRFSLAFQNKLIGGEHFEIEPIHIASLKERYINLLTPELFQNLSVECLESFDLNVIAHFDENQKESFVTTYYQKHPDLVDFQKFEPFISQKYILNTIVLNAQLIGAFTPACFQDLESSTILNLDFASIECIPKEVVLNIFDMNQRHAYFLRFAALDERVCRTKWNAIEKYDPLHLPRVQEIAFEAHYPKALSSGVYELNLSEQENMRVGFINGIRTTLDSAKRSAEYISSLVNGCNVHYVYNATHGVWADLQECLKNLDGYASEPVRELHKMWNAFFDQSSDKAIFLMVCHSQGAIHVRNALISYDEELRKRIHVVAIAPGAYIYPHSCGKVKHYRVSAMRDFVPSFDQSGFNKARATVRYLQSRSGTVFDHSFKSPTYRPKIRRRIEKYLSSLT